jgi:hypothetical protein
LGGLADNVVNQFALNAGDDETSSDLFDSDLDLEEINLLPDSD